MGKIDEQSKGAQELFHKRKGYGFNINLWVSFANPFIFISIQGVKIFFSTKVTVQES